MSIAGFATVDHDHVDRRTLSRPIAIAGGRTGSSSSRVRTSGRTRSAGTRVSPRCAAMRVTSAISWFVECTSWFHRHFCGDWTIGALSGGPPSFSDAAPGRRTIAGARCPSELPHRASHIFCWGVEDCSWRQRRPHSSQVTRLWSRASGWRFHYRISCRLCVPTLEWFGCIGGCWFLCSGESVATTLNDSAHCH